MEKTQLLDEDDADLIQPQFCPSYPNDRNRNVGSGVNGVGPHSSTKQESSSSTLSEKKSFYLSTTFDRSQIILGWEDINVFVHRQTGCFDRCLRRGRGNIEFVVNQILNGGKSIEHILFRLHRRYRDI